jgi:hypothetical protein
MWRKEERKEDFSGRQGHMKEGATGRKHERGRKGGDGKEARKGGSHATKID